MRSWHFWKWHVLNLLKKTKPLKRDVVGIILSCLVAFGAYLLVPFVGGVPLRWLLSIIVGLIVFIGWRRPFNIQPGTVTSVIALLVSYAALTHSISEWKQVNESKRPYFSIINSEIQKINEAENIAIYMIKLLFRNMGQRSAHDFKMKVIIIPLGPGNEEIISGEKSTVNDLPGEVTVEWTSKIEVEGNPSERVFGVALTYSDPVLNRCFVQRFVKVWEKDGAVFKEELNDMTRKVPQNIFKRIDDFVEEFRTQNCRIR